MDIKNVINQYYDMVHKIAYSKTQNVNDADDLTQEVFLKYLQSDKKFDSDDHIKNWLIRVTINTYLHQISSGWNKNTTYMTDELLGAMEGANSNFSYEDNYVVEDDIYDIIKTLPDSNRNVLWDFYYKDMSIRQIALNENKTESAVKMLLSRSRKVLREKMEQRHLISEKIFISVDKQLKNYFKAYEQKYIESGRIYTHRKTIKNICVVIVDMANGWTKPGHPFACDIGNTVVNARKICDAIRKTNKLPLMFTKTCFHKKGKEKLKLNGRKS